jgi:hypothetical protein
MSLPVEIVVTDVDALHRAIKYRSWYDAMPEGLETGDRFHENVSDVINELLPDFNALYEVDGVIGIDVCFDNGAFSLYVEMDDGTKEIPFVIK